MSSNVVNGGEVDDYRYYAFQVALFFEGALKCGASIIAPSFVLTAATCIERETLRPLSRPVVQYSMPSYPVFSPLPPPLFHVNLTSDPDADSGYYDIGYGSADKDGAKRVRASEVWIHNGHINNQTYNRVRISNNYAILKLVKPFRFSDKVRSISLSSDDSGLQIGDDLTVSGWGSIVTTTGPYSDKLKAVTVDHLPNICATKYSHRGYSGSFPKVWFDKTEMICAGCLAGGAGGCTKDSGGPLTAKSSQGGCPVQVGLGNWEKDNYNGMVCARDSPDVYARVSNAVSWIESVIRQPVRSTVAASPTSQCDSCVGNNHPSERECRHANKYDLQLCDMQSRLAGSFVIAEPKCQGGKHKLKAFLNFHRGFPGAPDARKQQLKQGHVFFFRTNKGAGNGVVTLADGVKINTPLKRPQFAGDARTPTPERFNEREGAWVYRWPGCSPDHTYAALYVLDMGSGKAKYYQISIAVGKVPKS